MAFTKERWQTTVMRLIIEERDRPALYRFRIVLLASLAYLYLGIILVGSLALAAGLVWLVIFAVVNLHSFGVLRLLIPAMLGVGSFIVVVLSAMWVKIPAPQGIEVTHEDAAPLLIEIDRLRRDLKVGRIHHILLSDEFNAMVAQAPRLGVFGWTRNYLVLGIPLMASLSPQQFRAVVAHELGHISGGHGRFSSWVYQLNVAWFQILAALEYEDSASILLFEGFFQWFAPLFAATTFPLRRAHEYEADRASARLVTPATAASALIATNIAARAIFGGHNGPVDRKTAQRWLNDALAEKTDYFDEHPTLTERLRALGQKPTLPEPIEQTALTRFLGYKAERLAAQVGIQIVFTTEETPASDAPTQPVSKPETLRPATTSPAPQKPKQADWLRPIGQ